MTQRGKKLTQTSEVSADDFDNIISRSRLITGFDEPIDKTGEMNKVGKSIPKKPPLKKITLGSFIHDAKASLSCLERHAQQEGLLESSVDNLPSSFVHTEEFNHCIASTVDMINQVIDNPHIDQSIIKFISQVSSQAMALIKEREQESSQPQRLNDLGLPMHPLEIEVADLIERVQRGEKPFDGCASYKEAKEQFDDIENTLDYLKKYFGKYLNVFNGGKGNYLYQVDLQEIDAKFRNSLRMYLSYHGEDIIDYVPDTKAKGDLEAQIVKEQGLHKVAHKINNLTNSRKLKVG